MSCLFCTNCGSGLKNMTRFCGQCGKKVFNEAVPALSGHHSGAGKPVCRYGSGCYRKNPDHAKEFDHPRSMSGASAVFMGPPSAALVVKKPPPGCQCFGASGCEKCARPLCWFGPECLRKDLAHKMKYDHTGCVNGSCFSGSRCGAHSHLPIRDC